MALYINKTQNSIVFNEEDFEIDTNYMPEIVLALMELNPEKTLLKVVRKNKIVSFLILLFA